MDNRWKVNDLALCIKQGFWRDSKAREAVDLGPKAGQVLTVIRVMRGRTPEHKKTALLSFREWGPEDKFAADRFVRISPYGLAEKEERSVGRTIAIGGDTQLTLFPAQPDMETTDLGLVRRCRHG